MNRYVLAALIISFSAVCNSADTDSIRIRGDLVRVGDSLIRVKKLLGKPLDVNRYSEAVFGGGEVQIQELYYEIGNESYVIYIRGGQVSRITWEH